MKVEDSFDKYQPRGKQRWVKESFVCWYVQTTGIWKSVWLESVSRARIERVKMTPSLMDDSIIIQGEVVGATENTFVEMDISFADKKIAKATVSAWEGEFEAKIKLTTSSWEWGVYRWTCETPDLYDIKFTLYEDEKVQDTVLSYFGMREISIKGDKVLLNGKPLYQRLVLDQGYWEESHLSPPSEEALIEDIKKIRELGYNGIRKHQKVEDERFLYWCDVLGVLVWSEMAAAYAFSDRAMEKFIKEWSEVVLQNYNHPSIITWVPFNESWGVRSVEVCKKQQNFTKAIYHLTKSIDSMRPVVLNDGWEHTVSDIITLHEYQPCGKAFLNKYKNKDEILSEDSYPNGKKAVFANGNSYCGQPVIISEFGGIAFDDKEEGWGYGCKEKSEAEFVKRFESIVCAIKQIPYISGYCYTQITDVQQEINGLLRGDRTYKVDSKIIKEINLRDVEQKY